MPRTRLSVLVTSLAIAGLALVAGGMACGTSSDACAGGRVAVNGASSDGAVIDEMQTSDAQTAAVACFNWS